MKKPSALISLIRQTATQDTDEAKILRQKQLLSHITTSEDQYDKLISRYSPEKLQSIIKQLDNFKYGVNASAPILCLGPSKCPFFHACPIGDGLKEDPKTKQRVPSYDDIDDFPIGDQCIVEKVFVEQKLIDYVQEFDVDPARPSELSLINDLALVDLYKNRAVLLMSAGDRDGEGIDFMKVDTSTTEGAVNGETRAYKEHPLFGAIDKLEKRRHKILEELVATRRIKAAVAAKFGAGIQSSQLITEIEKLRKALESKKVLQLESNVGNDAGNEISDVLELEEIIEVE